MVPISPMQADKRFFSLLRKQFEWVQARCLFFKYTKTSELIADIVFYQVDDDPEKNNYAQQAISLLRLVRKR